jgi:hypothetical protein
MNSLTAAQKRRVELMARRMVNDSKRKVRAVKKWVETVKRTQALPVPLTMYIANNYTNPVTLRAPPYGVAIYMITDPQTGRKNFYNKATIHKLAKLNNYGILMANRKKPIFKNPMTRSNVYPKNVRRVIVKPKKKTPSPKTAAKKIQTAVRKHLSKKKPKRVSK